LKYVIEYDEATKKIRSVSNKNFGHVLFTAEKIDTESGFQQHSTVEIYTNIVEEGVYNLLHMHVEDTSDLVFFIPN